MKSWAIALVVIFVIAGIAWAGLTATSRPQPSVLAAPAADVLSAPIAPVAAAASITPTVPASGGQTSTSDADLLEQLGASGQNGASAVKSDFADKPVGLNAGDTLTVANNQVVIDVSTLGTEAHFYHAALPDGRTVYFFVVKDTSGVYHAAANACQVCFSTKRGFHQEGNFMVCNTCGNRYPLERIATEKGGCNPVPINPNLAVNDGKVTLQLADLEPIASYF